MVLYISNSFSSCIKKDINLLSLFSPSALNIVTYPLALGNIKTNCLITLSKYPIEYLELVFVSTNFEMIILSTLASEIFIGFFAPSNTYFALSVSPNVNIIILFF